MWKLSNEDQAFLLRLARKTISDHLHNQPLSPPEPLPVGPLLEKCGAFVTLTQHNELRGCIGYTAALKPLFETVMDCAISAATRDPRFVPLKAEDLARTHIEISVLSPMFEVKDVNEIEAGKHGLMISRGNRRGLLLPQVATEYNLNREKFLDQTCMKAGLPPKSWKEPGTRIEAFTAFVFGEPGIE
ncbi:MAG: AmmeMemoRadiSam system protein A [Acidobacteriia bacterium]|nr:AmmeMemoRadiSam system protein A [Terriglobia bacterium]